MDPAEVLRLFDRQVRRDVTTSDPRAHVERDERTTFFVGGGWSALLWSDLDEASADDVIARVVARMHGLTGHVEWKLYGHDRPADLPRRLVRAGLEPDAEEAVLVAEAASVATEAAALPPGVELRVAATADDVAAFEALAGGVFGEGESAVGRELVHALEREQPHMLAVVCLADGVPVSGARVDFTEGAEFAGLYGGATLPEWRRRGLYRATVAKRAQLARERGYRYVQVDALPTSRPILERLGFVQLTTTTPYRLRRRATAG